MGPSGAGKVSSVDLLKVSWIMGFSPVLCRYWYPVLCNIVGKNAYFYPFSISLQTTLMNALTLDAPYGVTKGSVTLNGVAMTDKIFRQHSYLVTQYDRHWPFLTARETLNYAAELYDVALAEDIPIIVDEVVSKLGLQACEKTRNGRLSGGQSRRLSLAIALLKQPTLLFLDEPTSGLVRSGKQ